MLLKHGSRCLHHSIVRANRAPLLASLPPQQQQQHCHHRSLATRSRAAAVEHTADSTSTTTSSSSSLEEEQEFPEMQLVLPPPSNSQVKTAEFVKSSVEVKQCPPPKYPEFAVIGRSNVGKSSLINLLTNCKSLAMVSKQPGGLVVLSHTPALYAAASCRRSSSIRRSTPAQASTASHSTRHARLLAVTPAAPKQAANMASRPWQAVCRHCSPVNSPSQACYPCLLRCLVLLILQARRGASTTL
jgi:hypothetical protein